MACRSTTWPQRLRSIVNVVLISSFAMWMAWGPDLTVFYNVAGPSSPPSGRGYWVGRLLSFAHRQHLEARPVACMGHHVIEAAIGTVALLQLQAHPEIELLLTNHMVPSMTGVALAREARRLRPNLPSLLVTGFATLDAAANCLQHIGKRFPESQMPAMIDAAVEDGRLVPLRYSWPEAGG